MIPKHLITEIGHDRQRVHISQPLIDSAAADAVSVCQRLETRPEGLTDEDAAKRLSEHGPNVLAKDSRAGLLSLIGHAVLNPLVILLAILASISFATGDVRAGTMMAVMIALGAGLKLVQEARADSAAAKLKAMISVGATVIRSGKARDIPISQLVPGDIVALAAGDMIPADVRVLTAKDLFVNQSTLTGESFPVEKFAAEKNPVASAPVEFTSVAFLGTSVESGAGTAVVVATGQDTYLGGTASSLTEEEPPTAFDKGIERFTWLILRFVLVMVPLVFLINGFTKGNWHEAFFFAIAVAVGLTPEMLPMVVAVCLSKGAIRMSRERVIVKRLNAIQNLGAMDVLCTDKTGTLTMDRVILERH